MKQFVLIGVTTLAVSILAQAMGTPQRPQNEADPESCPLHAEHSKQQASSGDKGFAQMNERGAKAMGFNQSKTTHHFRILPDGGAIELTVNDGSDAADLNAIRTHLTRIAREFAKGNFTAPVMTHGEMPPGAETMRRLKDKIAYRYEELPTGARVQITTVNPDALRAVHEFFDYQIREHRTGDPQKD